MTLMGHFVLSPSKNLVASDGSHSQSPVPPSRPHFFFHPPHSSTQSNNCIYQCSAYNDSGLQGPLALSSCHGIFQQPNASLHKRTTKLLRKSLTTIKR